MSVDLFLNLLTGSMIITIALTECLKKLLAAADTPYRTNAVVLDSAMISSTGVAVVYRLPFGLGFEPIQVERLFLLILFTWFASMLVYDKLKQTKAQYKKYKEMKGDVNHVEELCAEDISKYEKVVESGCGSFSKNNGASGCCNNRHNGNNGCC